MVYIRHLSQGLFGTSRQLIVGPVALISLLLGNGLSQQMKNLGIDMDDDTKHYTQVMTTLAIQTSFIVGILNVAMGLFRLGFITAFLSHAVISGFISGASVIIFLSQMKHILGIKAEGGNVVITMTSLLKNIHNFNDKSFWMGSCSLILILLIKKLSTMLPTQKWLKAVGPILITVISILITWLFQLDKVGLPIVSYIPKGLPDITVGLLFPMNQYGDMIMTAVSISIIGFIESIAIVKSLSLKNNYDVDSSLELVGLGMSNLIGSIFQAYPSTGSFSRSAVNNDAGAQSAVSAMFSSMLVGFVLLFLTDVFQYMPLSVLAAIIISGVISLVDYTEAIHLWKIDKIDFTVWLSAFLGVTFLGVEMGLVVSVLTSLIFVLWESTIPNIVILGQLPESNIYRDVVQYPESIQHEGILIVQVNAPIYFMNADNIRLKILMQEKEASESLSLRNGGCIKFVIINMSSISRVDSYGLRMLNDLMRLMRMKNMCILFVNPLVNEKISSSICIDEIGSGTIFVSISDAVTWCLDNWGIATSVSSETIEEVENVSLLSTVDSISTSNFHLEIQF